MAAARGLPIPAPDDIPPELQYKLPKRSPEEKNNSEKNVQNLMVPISSRSQSYNSDTTSSPPAATSSQSQSPGVPSSSINSPLFRGRAKTLASLTTSSKNNSQSDMTPRELQLPPDQFVNGQPIEAYLYKNASECPICFLYYPPYLNQTRCCDQPICSECFVQIKRPDPHIPEHEQGDANAPAAPNADGTNQPEGELISEPAACPFCVQPEFGITYSPPPFRRGLTYAHPGAHPLASTTSPMSSSSSLSSGNANGQTGTGRRRATSLSANAPSVITTDKIRPDWAQKLVSARAHAARRSAAATALHTAAYLMNSGDSRGSGNRRSVLRRATGQGSDSPPAQNNASHLHALSMLSERRAANEREAGHSDENSGNLAPPRGSSRRNRVDDLEEMMMMEAIRLSLASEEERRKKEEKEAKKAAKKKEKEAKKAEKNFRKNGLYSNNASCSALDSASVEKAGKSAESSLRVDTSLASKGKEVDRNPPAEAGPSSAQDETTSPSDSFKPSSQIGASSREPSSSSFFQPSPTDPHKRSHLRHMSSASSSASSLVESASGEQIGSDSHGGESMFNFRSLAAVIGDEEKCDESAEHAERESQAQMQQSSDATSSQTVGKSDYNTDFVPVSHSIPTPIPEEASQQDEPGATSSQCPSAGDDFFSHKELRTNNMELLDGASKSSGTTA